MTQATIADIHAASTDELINEWCYSDAHKAVFGYRPHNSENFTREAVVHFWINFPRYWEDMEREEEAYLNRKREEHGIHFENLSAYYSWWEKTEWDRHCKAMEEEERQEAERLVREADYRRRRSIIDTIQDFDYGIFNGSMA